MKAGKGSLTVGESSSHRIALLSALLALCAMPLSQAGATIIGGVDFPQGALSFADVLVSYNPVVQSDPRVVPSGQAPDPAYRVPGAALGVPDFVQNPSGLHFTGLFVSLGNGGDLTLQFTDNVLTGSGDATPDLWVFEVGPLIEITFVEIS